MCRVQTIVGGLGPWLAALLALPLAAPAAEWFVRPRINTVIDYDDNRRLDPLDPQAELTERVVPSVAFGVRTPALDVVGTGRVEIVQSSDDDLDRENGFMGLTSIYTTPRNILEALVEWRQDSTNSFVNPFLDEGEEPGPATPAVDPDVSSLVRQEVQRTKVNFEPSWTHVLTPRTNLELGYRLSSTTFEDLPGTDLEDSTQNTVQGGLTYQLTPIDTLIGRLEYSHFDSESSVFDQGSVLGGLGHSFTETLNAELLLGATYTTFEEEAVDDDPGGSGDDTTFAVYLTVEKELKAGSVIASFQRDVGGGGFGLARRGTQFDARWDLEIVPSRLFFSLAGQAFKTEAIQEGDSNDDRTYVQIEPKLRWQFLPQLALNISYRYRRNDRDELGSANAGDSNAGIIGLVYTFDKYAMSR